MFILLGASATFMGRFISEYTFMLRYIGGGVIFLLDLHLLGILNIKALYFEKRVHVTKKTIHLVGVFIIGMAL
jgi:cytochrome c-type biogenesis protein